jgi:hypothetical protein
MSKLDMSVLDPVKPATLTVSSGDTQTKREMNDVNQQITEITAKTKADTLYDPPPPAPAAPGSLVSGFCNYTAHGLITAGVLLIIFAFINKRR